MLAPSWFCVETSHHSSEQLELTTCLRGQAWDRALVQWTQRRHASLSQSYALLCRISCIRQRPWSKSDWRSGGTLGLLFPFPLPSSSYPFLCLFSYPFPPHFPLASEVGPLNKARRSGPLLDRNMRKIQNKMYFHKIPANSRENFRKIPGGPRWNNIWI